MKNTILNLTQHNASEEQVAEGVVNSKNQAEIKTLLTFDEIPTTIDMIERATRIADIAFAELNFETNKQAMIGGAPFFMPVLCEQLKAKGIQPLFAFSKRVSQDGPNGEKVSVFKHEGFIPA